jgi:transposase-like protein
MKNKLAELLEKAKQLPESCLDEAISSLSEILEKHEEDEGAQQCPHCSSKNTRKYGKQSGKRRYQCKDCRRTFTKTTKTALRHSPHGEAVWKQVIRDTVDGVSLDRTAADLELTHNNVFVMRHKILAALENHERQNPQRLEGVCELDDTYVLESLKGQKMPEGYWRPARLHGGKAQKRGLSNEYVSICTGVVRGGGVLALAANRATPKKDDVLAVFGNKVDGSTLVLTDGAKSYKILAKKCGCTVENAKRESKAFYNLDSVNNFHSFIKERNVRYRGVATKYLNRYNALFDNAYKATSDTVERIYNILMSPQNENFFAVAELKTANLLVI